MKALQLHDLREAVVSWKELFFGASWARYDLAKPGTFRLVPASGQVPALRQNYQSMKVMYLSTPPTFDEVLETLAELEASINQTLKG